MRRSRSTRRLRSITGTPPTRGVSLADDTTQSLPAGPYDSAAYAIGIDGYTFQSADPVSFSVDGLGTPVEVTLYYAQNAPEPVNSTVTFHPETPPPIRS